MNAKSKYLIDGFLDTGKLDLYIGDILVTTYEYKNKNITLAARLNADTISLENLLANISQINEWINLIKKILSPENDKKNRFDEGLTKKALEMKGTFKFKGDWVTDASFIKDSGVCIFQPRGLIKINFNDFVGWANFLFLYYQNCKNF